MLRSDLCKKAVASIHCAVMGGRFRHLTVTLSSRLRHPLRVDVMQLSSRNFRRGFASRQHFVEDEVPVLIVGAGPVGVYLSCLLKKRFGVKTIVAERRPRKREIQNSEETEEPPHPKAHVLHTRSLELLRELGLDEAVHEAAPPLEQWKHFRYCTSLVGKEIASIDHCDDVDGAFSNLRNNSPTFVTHLSQPLLEDLLWSKVDEAGGASAEFLHEHEIESMSDLGDGVEVILRSTGDRETAKRRVRCKYVVGADGSRSEVRRLAGVECEGERGIENFISIHFRCPALRSRLGGRGAMLYFVFNSELIACVVAHDIDAGEWVLQAPFYPPLQEASLEPAALHSLVAAAVAGPAFPPGSVEGLPLSPCRPDPSVRGSDGRRGWGGGLEWELCSARPWSMDGTVASRLQVGRVLLVGDAAHQLPPSGGFGLNLGLQDAHNLAWKLATAVKRGEGEEEARSLVESYHSERHPVAERSVELAKANHRRGLLVPSAVGLSPDMLHAVSAPLTHGPLAAMLPLPARQKVLEGVLEIGRSPLFLLEDRDGDGVAQDEAAQPWGLMDVGTSALTAFLCAAHVASSDAFRVSMNRLKAAVLGGPLQERMREAVEGRRSIPMLFPHFDLGVAYPPNAAVRHRGAEPSLFERAGQIGGDGLYEPSGAEGGRLPHAWVSRGSERVSTLDLVGRGAAPGEGAPTWALLVAAATEEDQRAWEQLLGEWVEGGARVEGRVELAWMVAGEGSGEAEGALEGAWVDGGGEWARRCQLKAGGGVLVRPDGHIAWRSQGRPDGGAVEALLALNRAAM